MSHYAGVPSRDDDNKAEKCAEKGEEFWCFANRFIDWI